MSHMALRLRRGLSLSTVLLSQSLHHHRTPTLKSLSSVSSATSTPCSRQFHSTPFSFSSRSFADTEKIDSDTILFPGCDYNHWLIVMDFGKDPTNRPTPDQMVETYVNTAAKIFGSVEEAKKRIYACSTTTYTGFQVVVDEETSKKFEDLPGVIFVLPDSYIDPVNKEYGGDKYINGEIIPRPPPVQYGRPNRGIRHNDQSMRGPRQYQQGSPPYNQHGSMRGDGGQEPQRQNHQNYPPQQNSGPPGQRDIGGQYLPGGRVHHPDGQKHGLPQHQGNFNDAHNYPQGQISNNLRAGGDYVPQRQFNHQLGDQRYNSQGQLGSSFGRYPPEQQIGNSPGGRDGYLPQGQIGNSPGGYVPQGQMSPHGHPPQGQIRNNFGGYPAEQQIGNSPGGHDGYPPQGQIGNSPIGPGGYVPQGQMNSFPGVPQGYPPQGQMGFSKDNRNYNPPSPTSMPYEQSGVGQYAEGGGASYAPAPRGENQGFSQMPGDRDYSPGTHAGMRQG